MTAAAITTHKPLATYLVRHGDDNLVLAQRLAGWVSRAPDLEEDIAMANIALDHLGVATHLFEYAAEVEDDGRDADDLAFLRSERQLTNLLLVEQPNGDFAHTLARQLFVDAYQLILWESLTGSTDDRLAGLAAKAHKEARYHFRHSSAWVIRLGDGTEESRRRMQTGVDALWRFTAEPFEADDVDHALVAEGIGVDLTARRAAWEHQVGAVLAEATLDRPEDPFQRKGGRRGFHTEHLGELLAEMQWMPRAYPEMEW